jgi:hypothetical protein
VKRLVLFTLFALAPGYIFTYGDDHQRTPAVRAPAPPVTLVGARHPLVTTTWPDPTGTSGIA